MQDRQGPGPGAAGGTRRRRVIAAVLLCLPTTACSAWKPPATGESDQIRRWVILGCEPESVIVGFLGKGEREGSEGFLYRHRDQEGELLRTNGEVASRLGYLREHPEQVVQIGPGVASIEAGSVTLEGGGQVDVARQCQKAPGEVVAACFSGGTTWIMTRTGMLLGIGEKGHECDTKNLEETIEGGGLTKLEKVLYFPVFVISYPVLLVCHITGWC